MGVSFAAEGVDEEDARGVGAVGDGDDFEGLAADLAGAVIGGCSFVVTIVRRGVGFGEATVRVFFVWHGKGCLWLGWGWGCGLGTNGHTDQCPGLGREGPGRPSASQRATTIIWMVIFDLKEEESLWNGARFEAVD